MAFTYEAVIRMFRLDIDVSHFFLPLMEENGRGIVVTRSLELAIAPFEGLFLTGSAFNDTSSSMGFKLEDVTWDCDRGLFLAHSSLVHSGLPIAYIPAELSSWVDRGWRLGSFDEDYEDDEGMAPGRRLRGDWVLHTENVDHKLVERWPMLGPRARPKSFNVLLKALTHTMAGLLNNWSTAYAVDQTERFFTETELQEERSSYAERFRQSVNEFEKMTFDQQWEWRQKVLRTHPSLKSIVDSCSTAVTADH